MFDTRQTSNNDFLKLWASNEATKTQSYEEINCLYYLRTIYDIFLQFCIINESCCTSQAPTVIGMSNQNGTFLALHEEFDTNTRKKHP